MSTPTPAPPNPLRNSYWVIPGRVLAGEHPNGTTVEATRERLQRLMGAGVECFIDLTEPGEVKPYDPELPFSVEYLRKPVRDHGIPAQRAHMAEILDCIHDALQSGRCVYIHCRAGIGRTGTVVGCLLVERGFQGEDALDELNRLWQHCERSQSWASIPETDDQVGYVRKWKARAVFAEELSLASAAARDALAGRFGTSAARGALAGRSGAAAGSQLGGATPGSPGGTTAARSVVATPGSPGGTAAAQSGGATPGSPGGMAAAQSGGTTPGSPSGKTAARSGSATSTPSGDAAPGSPAGTAATRSGGATPGSPSGTAAGSLGGTAAAQSGVATPGSPGGMAAAQSDGATATRSGGATSTPSGNAAPGSSTASAGTAASGAATGPGPGPIEPVLRGLGLPLLDDDDDDTSDFERFNALIAAPTETPSGGGTTPPATQPSDWPSFGKQPASNVPGAGTPGHGGIAGRAAAARGATSARSAGPAGGVAPAAGAPAAGGATPASSARAPGGTHATGSAATPGSSATPGSATTPGNATTPRGATQAGGTAAAGVASAAGDIPTAGQGAPTNKAPADRSQPVSTRESTPDTAATAVPVVDDPLSDPAALSAARNLRDRFLGALLGLAVGDAVSAATQFRKPGTFTPVGDMIGGGPFDLPRGGWTDDTAMALCLADSLLERNGADPRDQMERYRRWQQEGYLTSTGQCVGITASTARAIAMSAWRRGALFGSHDPSQLDPEPLSRVAPAVMFFFASSGQAVDQATEAARTTCQAPAVLDACRSLARALHAALSGQPKSIVLEKAVQAIGTGPSGPGPGRTATSISASAALTAAVAAFAATANFRDAVLYAANLGGDSDVITAVCGQLAGAYYSVKAIPTSWHNGLMQKELITSYADRLLAHAMLGLSS